ncbi:MAG TPA: efflux transporter periplasmic adaptor subunit, partial [Chitinophagaceae bacterium]|nr:efflux transporter periplasmic adaptor subunit [Chitinophagaceae bacterium]
MIKHIGIVFVVLALFSCKSKPAEVVKIDSTPADEMVQLTPEQAKNAAIETAKPVFQAVVTSIKVNGMVDVPPQSLISVSFPLGGY